MDDQVIIESEELAITEPLEEGVTPTESTQQTKEVKKRLKQELQAYKDKQLLDEFIKNGGNATEAAMKVWRITNRATAGARASEAMKRMGLMARLYMEARGYHYGKMLDVAIDKMEESKTPEWFDRLMRIAGYADFMSSGKGQGPQQNVNIINLQKDLASEYVEGEIVEDKELPDEDKL